MSSRRWNDEEATVLQLIDAELERLREPLTESSWRGSRLTRWTSRAWADGVTVARSVSAERLQVIRDRYMAEPPRTRAVSDDS